MFVEKNSPLNFGGTSKGEGKMMEREGEGKSWGKGGKGRPDPNILAWNRPGARMVKVEVLR